MEQRQLALQQQAVRMFRQIQRQGLCEDIRPIDCWDLTESLNYGK